MLAGADAGVYRLRPRPAVVALSGEMKRLVDSLPQVSATAHSNRGGRNRTGN